MLQGSETPLADAFDAGLFDLDGVCYRGANPVEYAAESITAAKARGLAPIFVTNNASRPSRVVADQLASLGIPATEEDVYTAARAAAELAQEVLPAGATVYMIGGAGLCEELTSHGFVLVDSADDRPDAVVQGFDKSVTWYHLSEGALAVQAGATFIASNLDATLPAERGHLLGNGSLVKAVENATGVVPLSTGKPSAKVFHQAAHAKGASAPLAIGDRLNTDIAGGNNAGYPSLHVLTGVSTARDVALAIAQERPTFIATDLRSLLEAMPCPSYVEDRWVVGQSWARWTGSSMEVSGDMSQADENLYRAIVSAAWMAADEGADRETIGSCLTDMAVSRP